MELARAGMLGLNLAYLISYDRKPDATPPHTIVTMLPGKEHVLTGDAEAQFFRSLDDAERREQSLRLGVESPNLATSLGGSSAVRRKRKPRA